MRPDLATAGPASAGSAAGYAHAALIGLSVGLLGAGAPILTAAA